MIVWPSFFTPCFLVLSSRSRPISSFTLSPATTTPLTRTKSEVVVTNTKLHATSTATTVTTQTLDDIATRTTSKFFDFEGHKCYSQVTRPASQSSSPLSFFGGSEDKRPEIILIHGFGCSTLYWRETTRYLTNAGYTVHAVDLLGQGQSAKPGKANGIEYSIDLWSNMVDEYITQNSIGIDGGGLVVMGNSLGSCVALTLGATNSKVKGVGMYNCGVGMNSRNLLKDPSLNRIQVVIFTALFDFLDALIFDNIPLLTYVLNDVVTPDLLRNALTGLYAYADDPTARVDDELVESFYLPAKQEGSIEALNQIYTNDAGKTPMELYEESVQLQSIPMHLVWGTKDNVTPMEGPVGQFFKGLASDDTKPVSFSSLEAGHIPFDEIPESNESMVQWLDSVVMSSSSTNSNEKGQNRKSMFSW